MSKRSASKRYRHSVMRVDSDLPQTFDQQFWPVLMAIVVLCSIGAGAIVTLLSGPWMWGSLLVLPAAAAISITVLYRLDDSMLRRSLQFAILTSLAIHLLILILTSLTYIFGNYQIKDQVVMNKRPEKKIVVTNRAKQLVFQQPQKHQIPDVDVETQKQVTTTKTKPQPVPVVQQKRKLEQQFTKRRQTESTIPKLAKELSKLSRSSRKVQPKASSSAAQASASKPVPQATAQAQPAQTEMQKIAASASSTPVRERSQKSLRSDVHQLQPLVSRRKMETPKLKMQREKPTARMRASLAKIPEVASRQPSKPQTRKQQPKKIAKTQSSATTVNRQSVTRSTASKATTIAPSSSTSATKSVAKTARRSTKSNNDAIPTRQPIKNVQRQIAAKLPMTNNRVQPTAPVASAQTSRAVPRPQSIAVTRSTQGVSGTQRSRNLDRVKGGEASPTSVASDSSSKRQSNRASENIAMSSFQKTNLRERGRSNNAQRSLRSQNVQWATRSGSQSPQRVTAQGAAANIESSTAQADNRSAAEKGTSMLDIGSTKVVTEITTERRGGGGSPELSPALAQSAQVASGRQTNLSPVVNATANAAEIGAAAQAQALQLQADEGEDSAENSVARSERQSNSAAAKESQMPEPESSEAGQLAGATASRSTRRATDESMDGTMGGSQSENSNDSGNSRTRLAQAPNVERTLNFGADGGETTQQINPVQSGVESATTEMVRRATDSLSGGAMLGAASKVMAASMSSLPLFAEGIGDGKRRARESENLTESKSESWLGERGNNRAAPNTAMENAFAANTDANGTGQLQVQDSDVGAVGRSVVKNVSTAASVELELDAEIGTGGFADKLSRRVGNPSESSAESENLSPDSVTRFKRKTFGGEPDVSPIAPLAKQAFRNRNPGSLSDSGPQTEAAIERGLEFLARNQLADGSWSLGQFDRSSPMFQNQLTSDTAATGLALLAFQGAGYSHREFKYANQVKNALDWLVLNQSDDGGLFLESDKASNEACRMYSHAIAALALTEAYGMTQDPALEGPTQAALDYISNTQDPSKGGWRYFAERRKRSSDTSVTGWMMMALKSGKLAGLKTRQSTLQRIEDWLRVAADPQQPSSFRYNPYAVDAVGKSRAHGRNASVTMTSVGLLMQVYSGWKPTDEQFLAGVRTLLSQMPDDANSRVRDTYYWYYATQVIKHAGGEYWDQWSAKLHPLLVDSQEMSGDLRGSWDPYKPVPDRWGPHGGRLYVTTMNLLSLEVKYRLLPLYENTID